MLQEKFMNRSTFSRLVEDVVFEKKIPYLEAVIRVCDEQDIDPEDTKKFISSVIKEKLEAEAIHLNFLPRKNTLEFE
jgi:uncharacterized protein YdhG (YjbR/CyaY superfamily)